MDKKDFVFIHEQARRTLKLIVQLLGKAIMSFHPDGRSRATDLTNQGTVVYATRSLEFISSVLVVSNK